MKHFNILFYLSVILMFNCNRKTSIEGTNYYIYSRASGNNFDCFFRIRNDSFCFDFTNSKTYNNFSHKVIKTFREEIISNKDSFVISSSVISQFEIDSVVYYSYSKNGLVNFIYSDETTCQIDYNFAKATIDTSNFNNKKEKLEKFKLIVKFIIHKMNKQPFPFDFKDQFKKPITDIMFYKVKRGTWDCVTIPYNSSYLNFFKTFLPI